MVNGQWSTVILLLSCVATFFLLATTIKVVHRGAMRCAGAGGGGGDGNKHNTNSLC